jgi:hypothetical protein
VSEYLVEEVMRRMIRRSRALGLRVRGSRRDARAGLARVVAAEVAQLMRQCGPRQSL